MSKSHPFASIRSATLPATSLLPNRFPLFKTSIVLTCSLIANGCAVDPKTGQPSFKETFNSDDPCANNARNIGVVAGAVIGAVIGNQVNHNTGKYGGAIAGGIIGGLIGADMDRKKCALSKIAKKYALDMTIADVKVEAPNVNNNSASTSVTQSGVPSNAENIGLSVSLKNQENGSQFLIGSDELAPQAHIYFSEIADEYSYVKQIAKLPANAPTETRQSVEILKNKRILIIGHTDDTGSSRLNADLSERRAKNLGKIFRDAGIPDNQIFFQGAGETLPIADNRTEDGRAKNRRVEIVDLTDDAAFRKYLAARKARVDYYRITGSAEPHTDQTTTTNNAPSPAPTKTEDKKNAGKDKPTISGTIISSAKNSLPPTSASTAAGVPTHSASTPTHQNSLSFDFGGTPVGKAQPNFNIGRLVVEHSTFNLISSAQAADAPILRSCSDDRPRVANGVKSLRDNMEISTAEYMPNLYNTSWADTVNGHLLALTHVAVLRDGGSPAHRPELLLYKDYAQHSSKNAKPDFKSTPEVNTYKGEKGLLYRVFIDGPVRCMDIVIPNTSNVATGSSLYYEATGNMYVANFSPRIAK